VSACVGGAADTVTGTNREGVKQTTAAPFRPLGSFGAAGCEEGPLPGRRAVADRAARRRLGTGRPFWTGRWPIRDPLGWPAGRVSNQWEAASGRAW